MKTLEEVIKDRVIITSSLKELKNGETECLGVNHHIFISPSLTFKNMVVENFIILH